MNPRTIALLIILTLGVGYLTAHQPLLEEREQLQQQRTELVERARLDRERALILIDQLERERHTLEQDAEAFEAALPSQLLTSEAIRFLRERASSSGVRIDNLIVGTETRDADLLKIPKSLTFETRYAPLTNFLNSIETSDELPLTISELRIESDASGSDPNLRVDLVINLNAFDPQPHDPFMDDPWLN